MKVRSRLLIVGGIIAAFCLWATAVSAAEVQLMGLKLGCDGMKILKKYGNPTQIRIGGGSNVDAARTTGSRPAAGRPGSTSVRGMPPGMTMPGMLPGMAGPPGMTRPGVPGASSRPATASSQQQQSSGNQLTWVYKYKDNRSAEFRLNTKGELVQIAVYGAKWPSQRTTKGITLGDTYKDVLLKYGYPETHTQQGVQMLLKYVKSDRVIFTLVNNSVVAITIAL